MTSGLFNTKGYYATSIADVMQATGLQKGGIYNHFGSKEELALEVFHYNISVLGRYLMATIKTETRAEAKLVAWISAGLEVYQGTPISGGCPILNGGVESDSYYPPLQEAAARALKGLKRMVQKVVAEGIRSGEFRSDVNPDELADFFISAYEGGIFVSRLEGSSQPLKSVTNTLLTVIHGLKAE